MDAPLTGRCQCGAISYCVTGQVLSLFACHCKECQRQSGSAYALALWVRPGQVQLQGPTPSRWTRHTPSGQQMHCDFCPDCGTRLFHRVEGNSDILSIKPGTLDAHHALPEPVAQIWVASARPWAILTQVLPCQGNPDDWTPLLSGWKIS